MSASGDFTPPEFPSGITEDSNDGPPGVSPGVALAILAGVLALGIVAVFTIGQTKSGGTKLVARPTVVATVPGFSPSAAPSAVAPGPTSSAGASTDPATGATGATGTASDDPDSSSATGTGTSTSVYTPEFYVGECVNTNGSGTDFSVSAAGCSSADYKIIYAYQNETGSIDNDMSQCYNVNGNDNEFENGDASDGYTLYCMNSLIGDYSPRRANVDNCLDSTATYEVDCSNSRATWIVIGRLNGTTDTKGCSQFGSYDNSYFWPSAPTFVLCVDKYKH